MYLMDILDQPYYWGRITRAEAEHILEKETATEDGTYLVRERIDEAGVYAITLCCFRRFYNYRIDRLPNDKVVVGGSIIQQSSNHNTNKLQQFPGLIELIDYHSRVADPLVTTLSKPYYRPPVSYSE
ncbi:unnamed protein product [Didymodactylos carnosus]|uniref:SH2 domain-containing protein n=1 Tax=Didymodactylos carnosus TaxID=1234261 RepID=A0A8S2G4Q2_9BILA|nr:unnamed protein product [Didymodactylos carnosus]CAF4454404.1 unnamed protein product [Didymodactylos carnosus]